MFVFVWFFIPETKGKLILGLEDAAEKLLIIIHRNVARENG